MKYSETRLSVPEVSSRPAARRAGSFDSERFDRNGTIT